MEAIDKINKELLPQKDLENLRELYPSIKHDFDVKVIFRTETEFRTSVLNRINFPTPHARYWQSVREQQTHFEALITLSFDYREKKVELKKLIRDLTSEQDELEQELIQIKIERKKYDILYAEKVATERMREIRQAETIKREELSTGEVDPEDIDSGGMGQLKSHTQRFINRYMNANLNTTPPADMINLRGCALTAISRCIQLGIWDEVKKAMNMPTTIAKQLEGALNG